MGCWQETCALTNLPIYEGNRCVLVVMDKTFTQGFQKGGKYNPYGRLDDEDQLRHLEAIHRGTYNDYGWINEQDDPEEKDEHGVGRPLSQRRVTIFFHKEVWDKAVKAGQKEAGEFAAVANGRANEAIEVYRKSMEGTTGQARESYKLLIQREKAKRLTPDMLDLYAVARVAYWTRRDLMVCEKFHGCQSWENHYYEVVHDLTAKMYKKAVLDRR